MYQTSFIFTSSLDWYRSQVVSEPFPNRIWAVFFLGFHDIHGYGIETVSSYTLIPFWYQNDTVVEVFCRQYHLAENDIVIFFLVILTKIIVFIGWWVYSQLRVKCWIWPDFEKIVRNTGWTGKKSRVKNVRKCFRLPKCPSLSGISQLFSKSINE